MPESKLRPAAVPAAVPTVGTGAVAALLLLLLAGPPPAAACTALIAGRATTADGSILFAKSEDDTPADVDFLWRIPRRRHAPGEVVRLLGGGAVPQVAETWSYLWDQNPGTEFSNAVVNEWGVALGSNACPSREDSLGAVAARGDVSDGGIGFELRMILAERARTAREAVEIAADLLDRYGYTGSGRSLNIVGPREAWQLQMVCGRQYVARRVRDDEVAVLANTYSIREVDPDDRENFVCSPRLVAYAVERGWYDPDAGRPFDFAAAYASRSARVDPRNTDRQWDLARQADRGFGLSWREAREGRMPVAVRPDRPLALADVMRIFRDHYEGTDLDSTAALGVGPHEGPVRAICWGTTHRVTIVQQRADLPPALGTVVWRAHEQPCSGGFVPWYLGVTGIPAAFQMAPVRADTARGQRVDFHFRMPEQTWRLGLGSAGELFKLQADLVDGDRAACLGPARAAWDALEAEALAAQPAVEDSALALWERDEAAARALLTRHTTALAERSLAVARRLVETLPRTPGTLTARGRYLLGEGEAEAAAAAFEAALALEPGNAAAREGLREARGRAGRS